MSATPEASPQIEHLSRGQRRVLGVLLEKAFTTPESYPLTLKAATTGCNQKSNRDPVTNYSEEQVDQWLDELRELGLAGVMHSESGRTAKHRHFMRHKFKFTEPQLAILTELWLRGRQSLGDLRVRASRMAAIDTLEDLRRELQSLLDQKLIVADGPLDRRGAEVDHNWYRPGEAPPMTPRAISESDDPLARAAAERPAAPAAPVSPGWERVCDELRRENAELKAAVGDLRREFGELESKFEDLRRALGG